MQPVTGLKAGKMRKEGEVRFIKKEEISQDLPLAALEDVHIRSPSGQDQSWKQISNNKIILE